MNEVDRGPMGGLGKTIEADETYGGGKLKNRNAKQRRRSEKQVSVFHGKQAVVSLVEREGCVRSFHVARVTGETLRSILVTNADRSSWLMTDEHAGHNTNVH